MMCCVVRAYSTVYNTYLYRYLRGEERKTSETTAVVVYIYRDIRCIILNIIKVIRTSFRVAIMLFHYISLYIVTCCRRRHCSRMAPPPTSLAIKFKFDPSPPLSLVTLSSPLVGFNARTHTMSACVCAGARAHISAASGPGTSETKVHTAAISCAYILIMCPRIRAG